MTTRDDVFGHQDHRQTGTMIMTGENHPPRIIKQAATEVTAVLVLAVQEVLAVVMIPGTTLILGKNQSSSNNDNRNGGVVTLTTTISLLLAIVLLQGRETSTTMMIGVPLGIDQDGRRGMAVYGQGLRLLSRQYAIFHFQTLDVILSWRTQLKPIIFVTLSKKLKRFFCDAFY